jgi:hypothetical protein
MYETQFTGEKQWWWSILWKLNAPLKSKITLSLEIDNKLLTWDNGIKRRWVGPNRCALCKINEESSSHIFICCPYIV